MDIKDNIIRNVTRNSIEVLNCYKDENGNGTISIKENDIVTAQEGINVPNNNTPNGIIVGWFHEPGASPELTPKTCIKKNYVEGKGEASLGIAILSHGQIVKKNQIIVKDGFNIDSEASGIAVIGEGAVVCKNQITIKPTSGMPEAAGSGISVLSDYASIKENLILFDGEVSSYGVGIKQLASDGVISSNEIEGFGSVAVLLKPSITPTIQDNMIVNNDIEDFIPGWADVVFMEGVNFNTLVGKDAIIIDDGIGNIVISDDNDDDDDKTKKRKKGKKRRNSNN